MKQLAHHQCVSVCAAAAVGCDGIAIAAGKCCEEESAQLPANSTPTTAGLRYKTAAGTTTVRPRRCQQPITTATITSVSRAVKLIFRPGTDRYSVLTSLFSLGRRSIKCLRFCCFKSDRYEIWQDSSSS